MIDSRNRYLPYILAAMLICYGFFFIDNLPLSGPPDELAHLSYIADAGRSDFLLPNYRDGKIIGTDELNFLSHPPLYYSIQAALGGILDLNADFDYKGYRFISLLMVALGFLTILNAARLLGLSDGVLILLSLGSMAVPNFIYIASSINNDNLVFLGVAILFYSMVGLYQADQKTKSLAVYGLYLSLFIIALAKVNAALFALSFLLAWLFITKGKMLFELLKSRGWVVLAFISILIFGYYAVTLFEYGRLFPAPRYVYQLNTPENPLTFSAYAQQFLVLLTIRFSGAYGHTSYLVYPGALVYGLYFLLFSPLFLYAAGRLFSRRLFLEFPVYRLFDAVFFGVVVLFTTHLYKGYEGYLATGIVAAVQPRYYLFLVPLAWVPILVIARHIKIVSYYGFLLGAVILILVPFSVSYSSSGLSQAKLSKPSNLYTGKLKAADQYKANLPLTPGRLGHMDLVRLLDNRILMLGWAYDKRTDRTPKAILVFNDGLLVGRFGMNMVRPDVASSFKSLNANNSGFRINLPVTQESTACNYDLLAEFDDGIFSLIHDGSQSPTCD